MHITPRLIRTWADEGNIPDLTLAELDFRLTQVLMGVYSDPFLRDRLYLKGGTALNKLFFPSTNRLSVDLDFNAVGPKVQVMQERPQMARRVMDILAGQDADYRPEHDYRYEQSTIEASFAPLSGAGRQESRASQTQHRCRSWRL